MTPAEVHQEPLHPQILLQDCSNQDSFRSCASPASNDKDGDPNLIGQTESKRLETVHSSAAAFVEGGIQDACDDSCSICLEPFCVSDPATVTRCKHDYHLQCILEWAQRSKDCPMCWQPLGFEDPNSQELFDAIEQERSPPWMAHTANGFQFHQLPAFANYADFEERIMQHVAHQLARRGRSPGIYDEPYVHSPEPSLLRPNRAFMDHSEQEPRQSNSNYADAVLHNHSNNDTTGHESDRQRLASDTLEETSQRTMATDISSFSESLKSRFLVASSKWKETFTKTTHGFKEKWRSRTNNSGNLVADLRARGQVVSADAVRQAIRRIAPESGGKDNDIPTTSSSCTRSGSDEHLNKSGAYSQTWCSVIDTHLASVASGGSSHQTPGAAV